MSRIQEYAVLVICQVAGPSVCECVRYVLCSVAVMCALRIS
jgi:hypothetical protein